MVVDPVDPRKSEGDEIEAERGKNGAEASNTVLMGNLEFEHHDGDDDRDDSIGEGFETGWSGDVMGHSVRACVG
jgi:hypothetical protein